MIDEIQVDGRNSKEPEDIQKAFYQFYKDLFSLEMGYEEHSSMDECLRLIPVKVSAVEQDSLNKGLSIEEIVVAVDSLSNGKSPGIDCLPIEFYKKNKNWISVELLRVYEEAFAKRSLGKDINKGVIKLLPKIGDKTLVKN